MTKRIELTCGKFAIIDDEDYDRLSDRKWQYHHEGYAVSTKMYKQIRMHRVIIGEIPTNSFIDHINGNGLDNRKCNLRVCTNSQNQANRAAPSNNKSGYKGVTYHRGKQKWMAAVECKGKAYFCGYFDNVKEAALAYNVKAKELFGDYARLNAIN